MDWRGWIERVYWWWMIRTSGEPLSSGLVFVYISSAAGATRDTCLRSLEEAVDRIRSAGGGFGELVLSHLRFVAAFNGARGQLAARARGFLTPFVRHEIESPQLLACRLVWAATVIRLRRDDLASGIARGMETLDQTARETELRFAKLFPDSETWIPYLRRN